MAIVTALTPSFSSAAQAAPALTPADLEELRRRWVEDLTSRTAIMASPQTYTAQIATMDRSVTKMLTRVSPTPTRYFSDLDWTVGATDIAKSNNMRLNYSNLLSMTVAWATPGSQYEASADLLATIRAGLAHMHQYVYNTETVWFGNWWSWLIGATRPLADMMAVLQPVLDQSEIDAYCASIDHFVPNRDPRLQIHPSGVKESDGANRVDICRALIVRSVVQPDTELLSASIAALTPTWQYVTSGNGFFKDGSFIQHSTIGYTGTYGLVLLEGLAKLFALLAGTAFDITDPTKSNLTTAIEGSYAPFMFNGQMMDSVRGRAVSRIGERSIDDGNQLVEYVLRLAKAADPATAARWRGLCRQWVESNSAATILDTTNIGRLALVTELLSSDTPPVPDPAGPRIFPAMDRLVHRGSDSSWAMCVAMCSNRIAWNEGTGAENYRGVKTSQGMTYLYLADDDDHFDDEFWATFDLEAPPGTTVDMTTLPNNPEGQWGERTPPNEWTGGVVFDGLALAGMHLVAPGGTGLVARKSWLTLPDRVVALGADISTQSSAAVRSIVEHRNLGTATRDLYVDGQAVTGELVSAGPEWAHLEGVGGYTFLDGPNPVKFTLASRSGTWRRNSTSTAAGTDVLHTRDYATISYEHGSGAQAAGGHYAYVVLPGASQDATAQAASDPELRVLRNDALIQAVEVHPNVLAANFWGAGSVAGCTTSGAACLIVRRTPGMVSGAISDPTQQQDAITVSLEATAGTRLRSASASRIRMTRSGDVVTLVIDTRGLAGAGVPFQILR
jgi:hyaluronate lyase